MAPFFTEDQMHQFWDAIREVNQCRATNGMSRMGENNSWEADVSKSRLLGRILMQGLPPQDEAPPRVFAAGWYEVIDVGHAWLYGPDSHYPEFEEGSHWEDQPKGVFSINGYPDWRVEKPLPGGGWKLRRLRRDRTDVPEEKWLLVPRPPGSQGVIGEVDVPAPEYARQRRSETLQNVFMGVTSEPIEQDWLLVREGLGL